MTLKQAIEILIIFVYHGHCKQTERIDEALRICEIYIKPATDTEENWDM